MDRSLKVAKGALLILFFLPLVILAIVITGVVIPAYGIQPEIARGILGWCGLVGLSSLLMCVGGVLLVCKNIGEPMDAKN